MRIDIRVYLELRMGSRIKVNRPPLTSLFDTVIRSSEIYLMQHVY